jgi:hypothetical protein
MSVSWFHISVIKAVRLFSLRCTTIHKQMLVSAFSRVLLLVYYFQCLFLAAHICGNPEAQITNSVIVSGYTTPAVEGTTVTFQCLPGLVLHGINSSMCMENGEWEPAPNGVYCSGTFQ